MPGFVSAMAASQSQRSGTQYNAISELNDLNTCLPTNSTVRHSLPNNGTIRVDTTSAKALFAVTAPKIALEGHESTNSDFSKIERLVDFNWELSRNCNWIAVNNRKPLMAYVLHRVVRPTVSKASNVAINDNPSNQMIRVMNYETRHRCLAKGVFQEAIADLSFAINSVSSNSLDICKLAVADKGGNVYIYSLKEENGEISAQQVLAIQNDGRKFDLVRLSWCPYIPSEDDDAPVEGDPGLTLALSCDTRLEIFAIDLLQSKYKETVVVEITTLRAANDGYQLIDNAHDRAITSMSIAQEATAICTTGLDNKIRFFSVALNQNLEPKSFLKEWDLRSEYQYFEKDDQIVNFFFLDDFDFLLSQSDPIFWGFALLCTAKGHITIINLKDWRSKQSVKLTTEESDESQQFSYRMDLTAHHVLAIRGRDAFLLHIHFPHDKAEDYDECEPISNIEPTFDNSFPYICKVTRFQIYSTPLRSFTIKKSIDDNILIFWITGQSLELCHIDLSCIEVEESYPTYEMNADKIVDNIGDVSALNNINTDMINMSNIPNKDLDLMTENGINGFEPFDLSLMKPVPSTTAESVPPISLRKTPEPVVSSLNLLPMPPPPPPTFTQSMGDMNRPFMPPLPRPESPASKEVQQIFNPPQPQTSASKPLKSIQDLFNTSNAHIFDIYPSAPELPGALFPSKLPNILKDVVKEEQIVQLKSDLSKEIQDSENRVLRIIERMDQKLNLKLNSNNEQLLNNSKMQTKKLESDITEMKKELKNACKIRNDEFNKIVEKLVNKVMHEMNVIVQKGFQELMSNVDKELKRMTKDFDKQIQTLDTKISQVTDKGTHFQPLSVASAQAVTPSLAQSSQATLTPTTPLNPNHQPQQPQTIFTPVSTQRKTPQSIFGHPMTPQSASATPLPFATPKSLYYCPPESELPAMNQSWQSRGSVTPSPLNVVNDQKQQQLLQKQKLENDIWRDVGTGHLDQAIVKALNMRDPDMVVKICELFKDSPSLLIDRIKSEQTVLISLLQQIVYNRNNTLSEDSYWKTGFIEQIMTNLDLQNDCVVKILPTLAPKIVQLLDVIANSSRDSGIASKARILAFTFKHLKL